MKRIEKSWKLLLYKYRTDRKQLHPTDKSYELKSSKNGAEEIRKGKRER